MSRPLPKHLASREFVMSVIEGMRTAMATPGYVLDMEVFASTFKNRCVVFGLGGPEDEDKWSVEQWRVAYWCDSARTADWSYCADLGHPVPESAQDAWSASMADAADPDFFPAWERFANSFPSEKDLNNYE